MDFQKKWEMIDSIKPHPQFALIGGGIALAAGGTAAVGAGVALGGLAAGAVGGGLFGGGSSSSGGSSGGTASGGTTQSGTGSNGIPLSLLSSLTGGAALNSLFGNGAGSINASVAAGTAAADPFASQRAGYNEQLRGGVANSQNIANATAAGFSTAGGLAGMQGLASQSTANPALMASAGRNVQDPNIAALTNPTAAQNFEYQKGMDALMRGQAQSGTVSSGAQMLQLQNYGQQSASQFLQQDFNNAVTSQASGNATNNLNFTQMLGATQNNQAAQQQQYAQYQGVGSMGLAQSSLAGNQQTAANQLNATLTGATTGSPAEAGAITAGAYGDQQKAILSLLNNLSGSGTSSGDVSKLIGGLQSGVQNIGSLFGSGTGAAAGTQVAGNTGSDILAGGNNYSDTNYGGSYSYDTGSGIVNMNQDAGSFLSSGF